MSLFGFRTRPTYGMIDNDNGGFSISISNNGILEYKKYNIIQHTKGEVTKQLSTNSINEIIDILSIFQSELNKIPSTLDNNSDDGQLQQFIFNTKEINILNLNTTNGNSFEKLIYNVFKSICNILKKNENIELSLLDIKGLDNIKVKEDKIDYTHKKLIVIDVQLDTINDSKSIIPNIMKKIKSYINNGGTVIYTKNIGCEIYKDIYVKGCKIIDKNFGYLNWSNMLFKDDEIEIIGLYTDICVISNALIIKSTLPNSNIIVDSNCCIGTTIEQHNNALDIMKSCNISIIEE